MKSNIGRILEDYLDPDKWLYNNCMEEIEEDGENARLSSSQKGQITKIRKALEKAYAEKMDKENRKIPTIQDLFSHCPEGDFSFDGEPEDVGNAWNCGDSDCESGWHISAQYISEGRENGKTWFIVYQDTIAGCGDYQPVSGWDEREGDEVSDMILSDLWFYLEGRLHEHFYGWGLYNLYCAETGKDPLQDWRMGDGMTAEKAIKSAKENLKYLKK
jgi:hypothetical protein